MLNMYFHTRSGASVSIRTAAQKTRSGTGYVDFIAEHERRNNHVRHSFYTSHNSGSGQTSVFEGDWNSGHLQTGSAGLW